MSKEAKARLQINELLKDAGWKLLDDKSGRADVIVEGNVDLTSLGDDYETTSKGFIDYLLLDTKGLPLAILEAKSHDIDPLDGTFHSRKF
jgi:type I restriction enzyme R subunit